mmetsp:Transcript_13941/g.44233  ORF Transcript_13941/g.44233 Transcript_13941/m.44233 type:complete len:82 (+) Transcript_13941:1696-1941(+)
MTSGKAVVPPKRRSHPCGGPLCTSFHSLPAGGGMLGSWHAGPDEWKGRSAKGYRPKGHLAPAARSDIIIFEWLLVLHNGSS